MIKNNKNFKRLLLTIMLIITIFNALPVATFAAYITDINGDAQFGVVSGSLATYNHELHYANYDGVTYLVFCCQQGNNSANGSTYSYNSDFVVQMNSHRAEYKKVAEMIYFGYTMNYGTGIPNSLEAKRAACACQQYVWEYVHNNIDSSWGMPSRDSWNSNYMSSSIYSNWLSNTENTYNNYHNVNVSFNNQTNKVNIGSSATFTDTNGILASYPDFNQNVNGVTFIHTQGSNDMIVDVNSSANSGVTSFLSNRYEIYRLMPNGERYNANTMASYLYFHFNSGTIQDMMFSHFVDPNFFNFNIEVQSARILLTKVDNFGAKVDGCTFKLYSNESCTQEVATGITNGSGEIVFDKLLPGTYYVKEISAKTGYLINTEIKKVSVENGGTGKIEIKNNEPTGEIKIYKVNDKNDKVEGAEFLITAAEKITNVACSKTFYTKGQEVARIKSNSEGIAQIKDLPLGKYEVQECNAPQGYLLNETKYPANLEFKNSKTSVVEIKITGVVNDEPTGTIAIVKKDSKTGSTPQGDATLENAVYKVYAKEDIYNVAKTEKYYSKGDLVATRTTDNRGNMQEVNNLPLGKYIVKEDVASNGYLLDTKEYEVELVYKDQYTKVISQVVTSNEDVKEQQIHIFKSGIKVQSGLVNGLQGAEFTIKLNSDVEKAKEAGYTYEEIWNGIDEYGNTKEIDANRVKEAQIIAPTYQVVTTDESGNAYTKKLPFGKYIVKETNTPKDFETAEDFTFTISKDESEISDIPQKVKVLVVNNEQTEAYIRLVKKDAETGKRVSLSSATFQIKATKDIYDRGNGKIVYKKGEVITQKIGSTVYDSFTTNALNLVVPDESYTNNKEVFGTVITPLKLPVGSYEITEIKTPNGFLQLDNPVTFKIEGIKNYDTDKQGDYLKEVELKNGKPKGKIIIDKTIAIKENVDTSIVDVSDLSGIEFKLYAKEDIIDFADGSKIYEKGQEINKYNLTKDGKLTISNLPMGKYELQETKTIDGLVLNTTKYEFNFTQKDTTTKEYTEEREVINDTTLTEFSKQDITGEKELEGAKLQVLDEQENVIGEWISTKKQHSIEGLIVGKEYTLRETIAPDNYVKSTDVKFKIQDTNEIQHVKMIDKVVEMTKTDIGGEELEGAKIQVFDKDNNLVDEWISEKTPHKIKGLEENETYKLHEEVACNGYVKATDVEFKVTEEKQTQKVTLIDKIVEVTKTDLTTGEELVGAELVVTDENGNVVDKWTSTKDAHHVNNLEEGKKYTLTEYTAPYGYEIAESIEFVVTTDKEIQKCEMKDKPILKNIRLIKQDSDTKEVIKESFAFGLYEDEECSKLIKEVYSNKEDGTIIFEDLRYGTYYIKETKQPTNYLLSDIKVKIEINDKGVFMNDQELSENDNAYGFIFYNQKAPVINTGNEMDYNLITNIMLLSVFGIIVGITLFKNRKKENADK